MNCDSTNNDTMKKIKRAVTTFLFTSSSFFSGAATVINLGGNYYLFNFSRTPDEADNYALRNDFTVISQDFTESLNSLNN